MTAGGRGEGVTAGVKKRKAVAQGGAPKKRGTAKVTARKRVEKETEDVDVSMEEEEVVPSRKRPVRKTAKKKKIVVESEESGGDEDNDSDDTEELLRRSALKEKQDKEAYYPEEEDEEEEEDLDEDELEEEEEHPKKARGGLKTTGLESDDSDEEDDDEGSTATEDSEVTQKEIMRVAKYVMLQRGAGKKEQPTLEDLFKAEEFAKQLKKKAMRVRKAGEEKTERMSKKKR